MQGACDAYETIAFSSETLVFLFLGMGLFAFSHPYEQQSIIFVLLTVVYIFLARAINFRICSWLVNLARTSESRINFNMQYVMWISGLREAMDYALALKS
jgi:NhaP-type Na+/H+ or K+/H+ antiporter